jgi:hypothetical protein
MNTLNGTLWFIYGLVLSDPFIWVPNGAGAALGVLQTSLRLLIPRKDMACAPACRCNTLRQSSLHAILLPQLASQHLARGLSASPQC